MPYLRATRKLDLTSAHASTHRRTSLATQYSRALMTLRDTKTRYTTIASKRSGVNYVAKRRRFRARTPLHGTYAWCIPRSRPIASVDDVETDDVDLSQRQLTHNSPQLTHQQHSNSSHICVYTFVCIHLCVYICVHVHGKKFGLDLSRTNPSKPRAMMPKIPPIRA
jgi:hypothetical protein